MNKETQLLPDRVAGLTSEQRRKLADILERQVAELRRSADEMEERPPSRFAISFGE